MSVIAKKLQLNEEAHYFPPKDFIDFNFHLAFANSMVGKILQFSGHPIKYRTDSQSGN
jgi:hypothetical protein